MLRMLDRDLHSNCGPTSHTGGLLQDHAPVIYPYHDFETLLAGEAARGRKATLPGPGDKLDSAMSTAPDRLACGQTWAGNARVDSVLELPGLVGWVHSVPLEAADGGDVHYLSVCPSCIVSRVALADVSGHGRAVASLGNKLRELMQMYLNELDQTALMADLNTAVHEELANVHYASMVTLGYHGRRGLLALTSAGHPPPLWHRATERQWVCLDEHPGRDQRSRPAGVPLGLLPGVTYHRRVVRPGAGDLIVLYTDGVSEATPSLPR